MRSGKYGLVHGTADVFAALRAAGATEPGPAIRHPDWMASQLLPWTPRLTSLAKLKRARPLVVHLCERVSPGAYYYELARGRHMDEVLLGALERGIAQLVILGAGMDTRAYRFRDELRELRGVFEVDHPITAAHKRTALRRAFGNLPSHVTYAEVDLDQQDLGDALRTAGYDQSATTLFIWSGVSGYLTPEAVDAVLTFVSRASPNNEVVFDYWHDGVIRGEVSCYGAEHAARRAARLGEPYRSGIDPGHIEQFLNQRGLGLLDNAGPEHLEQRYLQMSDGQPAGKPHGFLSIAHARALANPLHDSVQAWSGAAATRPAASPAAESSGGCSCAAARSPGETPRNRARSSASRDIDPD